MKKRLLLLLLTFAVVISFMPAFVFGNEDGEESVIENEATEPVETVDNSEVPVVENEEAESVETEGNVEVSAEENEEEPAETKDEGITLSTKEDAEDDIRIYGEERYETATEVAEKYKGVEGSKFKNVVVADGRNFPDALAGGYLARVKDAPILLVEPKVENRIADYINKNIESGGTVYILGGTSAVSSSFENKVKNTKRLGGETRYETNLEILKEAGVTNQDLLVCTGTGYADSLSASAAERPILLVGSSLNEVQKSYLSSLKTSRFYLIGGVKAVDPAIEAELRGLGYSKIKRLAGESRYDTSTKVANEFFKNPRTAMLVYAENFPDGLSGGPLAMQYNSPIILTASNKPDAAKEYIKASGTKKSITIGGPKLISYNAMKMIMNRSDDQSIDTYVFFGSDSRKNDESWKSKNGGKITNDKTGTQGVPRSDVVMLIVVNNTYKTIEFVSVYRDTAVNKAATDVNFQKANKAYADYGPKEACRVLERNLDIKIKGYAAANFKGVADVIDDLGGVTVDGLMLENEQYWKEKKKFNDVVDDANGYIDEMNGKYGRKVPHIQRGADSQHLEGLQAVAYARVRYTAGSDMARTVRQKKVLVQMIKNYRSLSDGEKINLITSNAAGIETDLGITELAELIKAVSGYKIDESLTNTLGFPYYKRNIKKNTDEEKGGKSDLWISCDLETNVKKIHEKAYYENEYTPGTTVRNYSQALKQETGFGFDDRITSLDEKY